MSNLFIPQNELQEIVEQFRQSGATFDPTADSHPKANHTEQAPKKAHSGCDCPRK